MSTSTLLYFYVTAILGVALVGLLLARLLAFISRLTVRHKQHAETVIAEYEAPQQLSAAELGYIIDARFGDNELLATIAQLYAKGAIHIVPGKGRNFSMSVSPDATPSIDDSEAMLIGLLRDAPDNTTDWASMSSALSSRTGMQSDFESAVLQSLVGKGFLNQNALHSIFFGGGVELRLIALVVATALMAPVYIYAYGGTVVSGFASLDKGIIHFLIALIVFPLWFVVIIYLGVLRYNYFHRDGTPIGATKALYDLWPDIAGYQLFLRETEYVRLQHDEAGHDSAMPYCLALGLDPGFSQSIKSK